MKKISDGVLSGAGLCFLLIAGLCVYQAAHEVRSGRPTDGWLLFFFAFLVVFATCLSASLPDIKSERQVRYERLNSQPSQRAGWSLEENRARVLAHLEQEARAQQECELDRAASEFNLNAADVIAHELELVS